MTKFSEYIDALCREHAMVRHSDEECHFSDLSSDFANKLKRIMHFPCVSIDTDGFIVTGTPSNMGIRNAFNIYFLEHVRDTGNHAEVMAVFSRTRVIMFDFLRRMQRDRRNGVAAVAHFELAGTEGTRIEFKDAALYGWALSVLVTAPFNDLLCNDNLNS